uniref:Uncharacterized protein n=1 Tax=Neobodo designis TaxID=312471 RepID=A0A7S1L2Y9_NEODS
MNRANLWSLVDEGDAKRLERAVDAAPTALKVSGWSYASGQRRGLVRHDDGTWSIEHGPSAVAMRALHVAAVRGSEDCARILFAAGADTHAEVLATKADVVADACGHEKLADLIRVWQRRQADPPGAAADDEATARAQIELDEEHERKHLGHLLADGLVDVCVVFRSGLTRAEHQLTVPRYTSYRTLLAIIEEKVGERVMVAFTAPVSELAEINHSAVLRLSGALPLKCLNVDSDSDDPANAPNAQRTLALKPRTVAMFLHLKQPRCTARPLGGTPSLGVTPEPVKSSFAARMRDINASTVDRSERFASLRQLVADEERAISSPSPLAGASSKRASKLPAVRTIDPDQEEKLVGRLYGYAVQSIKAKKDEQDAYLADGEQLLWRRKKVGEPSEEQAESIERLYSGGQARKQQVIAEALAKQEQRVVKAKTVERSDEEIAEASSRLYQSAKGKQESIQRLATKVYGEPESKRLDSQELSRLVASVYTEAVDKKQRAREKAAASTTDFKAIANKKKLSKTEVSSMADRLSKRP